MSGWFEVDVHTSAFPGHLYESAFWGGSLRTLSFTGYTVG